MTMTILRSDHNISIEHASSKMNDHDPDSDHSDGGRDPTNNTELGVTPDDGDETNDNAAGGETEDGSDGGGGGGGGGGIGGRPSSYFMEGYTPLNFNMNAMVMMDGSEDDSDSNSDGDGDGISGNGNGEMDGDLFENGYYHMMGAPPRRLNGVKDRVVGFSMPNDYEEDGASSHMNDNVDGNDTSHSDDDGDAGVLEPVEVPDDFLLLAEQALRGLEVEHLSTLERYSVAAMDAGVMPDSNADTPVEKKDAPITSAKFEACFASFDEEQLDESNKQCDEPHIFEGASAARESAAAPAQKKESLAIPKMKLKEPNPKSKPMDVGAIQKAMQSIRLKSPRLAGALDAGASTSFSTMAAHVDTDAALVAIINSTSQAIEQSRLQKQQLVSHSIIPAGPLAAFRRTTPKAQAASAKLTRSATLSEAVLRLWPLICFRRRMRAMGLGGAKQLCAKTSTLTIHILGADGVECSSEDMVRQSVGSFVRWMDAALCSGELRQSQEISERTATGTPTGIDSLLIEFSGPNMPTALIGKVMDLLESNSKSEGLGLVSAKAIFQQREYHEPGDNIVGGPIAPPADIAIAYNAGIWGYDSWKPTLAHMCEPSTSVDAKMTGNAGDNNSGTGRTLFVITAYTVEECEDDAEVIAEVVEEVAAEKRPSNMGAIARQFWAPETNTFSSRLERKTASAPPGRKYYENGAWQAWLLGL
ncbi:hypothetical protein ACHAXR_011675 [Thalassiosira sp. AJA248-18]